MISARALELRRKLRISWHNWRLRLAMGPRYRLGKELQAQLHAALPGLEHRLRRRYIPELCQLTLAQESNILSLEEEEPQLRKCTYATLLMRLVNNLWVENQRIEREFASLVRQCQLALDEEVCTSLIEAYLREHATSYLSYLGDLRALSRALDLDALRERCDEARYQNFTRIEMAIRGLSHLWRSALDDPSANSQLVLTRLRNAQPAFELARLLGKIHRWPTQLHLTEELGALCAYPLVPRLDDEGCQSLVLLFQDEESHPWVRRNCIRILYHHAPRQAIEYCKNLIESRPQPQRFAFLARSLFLGELARISPTQPTARELVLEHWHRGDPSEHLRLRLVECLASTGADPTRVIQAIAQRICLHHSDRPTETSPKVRARGLHTITTLMLEQAQSRLELGSQGPFALGAQTLSSSLQDEQDPWVLKQVCVLLQRLTFRLMEFDPNPRLTKIFEEWNHGLGYCLTHTPGEPELHHQASAALERIAIAQDPTLATLHRHLLAWIPQIPRGARRRFTNPAPLHERNPEALGRVMAHLSRGDWGLYAKTKGDKIWLQRGERWSLRFWRVLHELRTPGPNKRKGFIHSNARRYAGRLRAHPEGLDEATQTVVPGERVHVENEAGWARHLPNLDDLLEFPWRAHSKPLALFSNYGVTRIEHPKAWRTRWRNWLSLSVRYAHWSGARLASLQSQDPALRQSFLQKLREAYAIQVTLSPYPQLGQGRPSIPDAVEHLFQTPQPVPLRQHCEPAPKAAALVPMGFVDFDPGSWLREHAHYLLSEQGNDQHSLSLFLTGMLSFFLFEGYRRRRALRIARAKIPLSIGGWGTRGKSGTERLKSAMLHGLGYRVFSKTTGCEAMFIHSTAEGPQSEVFVFRPYGKATIWEQADLVRLSARLDVDVFLWECMALNPTYVSILQHGWMNDDFATITNAYPDHEDIQGPAGFDVARVISKFIPKRSVAISSEINFHPMMRDQALAQKSEYHYVEPDQDAWVGDDFLALFPYQEHPRNIALVTKLGQKLHIDPDLAIYNMAKYVVPDLGVLKTYGDAQVQGRTLRFINGCSANERAGFLNNWHRTGCDRICVEQEPHKMLATVVNNRADRISRSELFARILVNDAAADRHILIGTNLGGLQGYIHDAIQEYLDTIQLITPERKSELPAIQARLESALARFRCPAPRAQAWIQRLKIYAQGAGLEPEPHSLQPLHDLLQARMGQFAHEPQELAEVLSSLTNDTQLTTAFERVLSQATPVELAKTGECLDAPSPEEIWPHWSRLLARALCVHQLRTRLTASLQGQLPLSPEDFQREFKLRFSELMMDTLHVVQDSEISGDQLVVQCASLFPPGVDLTILGTQNIKGTGLDFVYRWVALDKIQQLLQELQTKNEQTRAQGLAELEAFADHGILDLGLMRHELAKVRPLSDEESEALERLEQKTAKAHTQAKAALSTALVPQRQGVWIHLLNWIEGWFEFLDGARRFHQSRRLSRDLVHRRISHARATLEMREVYARTKGGWLAQWWLRQ